MLRGIAVKELHVGTDMTGPDTHSAPSQHPEYSLIELLDVETCQRLLDSFCDVVGTAAAIIDLKGTILIGARWQRICTDFHRMNKQTLRRCIESDTQMANELQQGKRFSLYRCRNGLTDAASPVMLEGRHVANVFVGQFLLEPPDLNMFRRQAAEYGFVEEDYLAALAEVPIFSEQRLSGILEFLATLAEMVGAMGLDRVRQIETEKALRASETKYRELVENANSIILRMDREGNVLFFNEFAQKFFGYTETEIRGRNVVGTIIPETESSARHLKAMIEDIGRNPEHHAANENENIRRDGTRSWIAWTNRGILDDEGNIAEILCVGNDITQRKALADQLRRAQKLESIGTLASGVAHNFNNILGIIVGHADLARMQLGDTQVIAEHLSTIAAACERATRLAKQLLSVSRRESTGKTSINVHSLVSAVAQSLRVMLDSNIEVSFEVNDRACHIEGDCAEVEQALMNICLNARDAMPDGGMLAIDATVAQLPHQFRQGGSNPEEQKYVRFRVADTGSGMDEDTLGQVFDPFFTTKGTEGGTGLGLSTTYGTVTNHGGYIDVTSEVGKGTTFSVYLPLSGSTEAEQESAKATELLGGSESVLVVDDEESILELARRVLESLGYTVLTASSGMEAVDIFEVSHERIDLVLLDYMMPRMTGEDTFRELQRIDPNVRVLVASGYDEQGKVKPLLDTSVNGFIHKPFRLPDLSQALRAALDHP